MNPSKQTTGQPVEVPADFPSFDHTGVLAGDHPRSTLVKYEDKYYERGSTPPEVRVDYEMCEDLAHQVMVQCQRKLAQGVITRDAVLELALDRLRDKPWCTLPQNVLAARRSAAGVDGPSNDPPGPAGRQARPDLTRAWSASNWQPCYQFEGLHFPSFLEHT